MSNGGNRLFDFVIGQQFVSLPVDDLPLIVSNIIVFKQLLSNIKVPPFYLALRFFDGVGHHAVLNGLASLHTQRLHKALHPLRGKDAHQIVFKGQVKTRHTGITLSARAPAQLVVDSPRFMALSAEDVQPTRFDHCVVTRLPLGSQPLAGCVVQRLALSRQLGLQIAAEHDVGPAAGHIGRNGDDAGPSSLRDNLGFLLVILGIQHFVLDFLILKRLR